MESWGLCHRQIVGGADMTFSQYNFVETKKVKVLTMAMYLHYSSVISYENL